MSPKRLRVQVSLSEKGYEALARLARARKVPMSRPISELWESTLPVMARVTALLEAAAKAPAEAKEAVAASMDRAQSDLEHALLTSLQDVRRTTSALKRAGRDAPRSGRARKGDPRQ